MRDIVERLRKLGKGYGGTLSTNLEAADEIERLRTENAALLNGVTSRDEVCERLRAEVAALKGSAEPVLWFDKDTFQISREKPMRPTYIPLYTSPRMLTEQAPCNVPEGWVMVPKEPTPEWCNKFARITIKRWPLDSLRREILHVIAAAPKKENEV